MKRKSVFILGTILIMLGITLFVFLQSESRPVLLQRVFGPSEAQLKARRLRLHPLTSKQARETAKKVHVETWEEWIGAMTEIGVGGSVEFSPQYDTPEKIAALRMDLRSHWVKIAERFKTVLSVPPLLKEPLPWDKLPTLIPSKRHEGPQTTEALMASFDEKYVTLYPYSLKWDSRYPREEFLQMLIDRGVPIENRDDYKLYLNMRGWLINAESRPEWWAKGMGGVEPTDNFEDYKNGFIERKIWMTQTYKRIVEADPTVGGLFFFDDRPNAYLPMKDNVLYVHRDGPGTRMWGELPTEEQQFNLIHHGIHPEGVEVIYVDENYNVRSNKPAPYDPGKDGTVISERPMTPKEYEAEFGEPIPKMDIETGEHFLGDSKAFESNTFDAERAKRAESEFEASLRDFEKFSKMTDDEIEAELEKQATSQVPTDDRLETELREHIDPGRFSKPMATLRQYGREEGLRRLAEKDPEFAQQLQRFLERQRK